MRAIRRRQQDEPRLGRDEPASRKGAGYFAATRGDRVEGRDTTVNRIIKRMAIPVGAAIVLGSSGFAFMASNTFAHSASFAGEGSQSISGYTVDNVHYITGKYVEKVSGYEITGVTFTLNAAASPDNVYATVSSGGRGYAYDGCTEDSAGVWTCVNPYNNLTLAQVDGASSLTVVAAQ